MLTTGTRVQYRQVGKGTITEIAPRGIDGEYRVKFETGRYRNTEVNVWLRDSDAIAPRTYHSDALGAVTIPEDCQTDSDIVRPGYCTTHRAYCFLHRAPY